MALKTPYGIKPATFRRGPSIESMLRPCDSWMLPMIKKFREEESRRKLSGLKAKIYALVDPFTDKVFYVGSTKSKLNKRLSSHIRAYSRNPDKSAIIKKIISKGKKPLIIELFECPIENQFYEERRWIVGARRKYKITNIL